MVLEKLIVIQAVKGFPINYGPQSLSALFKRALSKATCIVSVPLFILRIFYLPHQSTKLEDCPLSAACNF